MEIAKKFRSNTEAQQWRLVLVLHVASGKFKITNALSNGSSNCLVCKIPGTHPGYEIELFAIAFYTCKSAIGRK
ncbi:unnamed protein product [Ceratitis capitata]|uniref:(Mediterranean fruit fly) hypothetical protein n=1 Tax=Ceratitis capitata TaxID=7213 RepID=A0A811UZ20_CERCA|nr:unnamed protein product [Ceratitis capitata]